MERIRLRTKNANADVMIGGTRNFTVNNYFLAQPLTKKTVKKNPHRKKWRQKEGGVELPIPQAGTQTAKSDHMDTSAFAQNPPKTPTNRK